MKAKKSISANSAQELQGKTIKWSAPGYGGQSYGGVAKIISVTPYKTRPIIAETVSGDDLSHAFNSWGGGEKLDEPLCYSDDDRFISYEIAE